VPEQGRILAPGNHGHGPGRGDDAQACRVMEEVVVIVIEGGPRRNEFLNLPLCPRIAWYTSQNRFSTASTQKLSGALKVMWLSTSPISH
jgi:hypothetical protein